MFNRNKNKPVVLFAGAEIAPLVKVGGLGDVMGSLPKALASLGVDVKIIIPYYGAIKLPSKQVKLVKANLRLKLDGQLKKFSLYQTSLPNTKIPVYLIASPLFKGEEVYIGKRKYVKKNVYSRGSQDIERFVFFSKAVVETIKQVPLKVDIVHCHDWHTALIPTFIDEESLHDYGFYNLKTLFTIHNLANQGIAGLDIIDYAALDKKLTPAIMEDYYDQDGDRIDLMKIGILTADLVNTVSPSYAKEILTKAYGAGLQEYLKRRKKHLSGIINGIDTQIFNPQQDKNIKKRYTASNFSTAHLVNKKGLQQSVKLPIVSAPVFGLVSRLVKQKGLDILLPTLEQLLKEEDIQVIILGSGQEEYEQALRKLARKYSKKLKVKIGFNLKLAQQIYAGADWFLMPSQFEPCGLGQLIAMRYGCLPIVRKTGGLKDTVKHKRNGLVFSQYKAKSLVKVIRQAIKISKQPVKINRMVRSALAADNSWTVSAKQYLKLYNKLK